MTHTILMLAVLTLSQVPEKPEPVFVGYLFGSHRDLNYKLYTHICHAFLVADGDGVLRQGRNVPSRELTGEAHKASVKVMVSLGGWGWDHQFAAIVARKEAEDRYVKDVLGLVRDFDYDGIDLDWEYPDTEAEVAGFERLTRPVPCGTRCDRAGQGPQDGGDDGRVVQSRHPPLAENGLPGGDDGLDQRDDV